MSFISGGGVGGDKSGVGGGGVGGDGRDDLGHDLGGNGQPQPQEPLIDDSNLHGVKRKQEPNIQTPQSLPVSEPETHIEIESRHVYTHVAIQTAIVFGSIFTLSFLYSQRSREALKDALLGGAHIRLGNRVYHIKDVEAAEYRSLIAKAPIDSNHSLGSIKYDIIKNIVTAEVNRDPAFKNKPDIDKEIERRIEHFDERPDAGTVFQKWISTHPKDAEKTSSDVVRSYAASHAEDFGTPETGPLLPTREQEREGRKIDPVIARQVKVDLAAVLALRAIKIKPDTSIATRITQIAAGKRFTKEEIKEMIEVAESQAMLKDDIFNVQISVPKELQVALKLGDQVSLKVALNRLAELYRESKDATKFEQAIVDALAEKPEYIEFLAHWKEIIQKRGDGAITSTPLYRKMLEDRIATRIQEQATRGSKYLAAHLVYIKTSEMFKKHAPKFDFFSRDRRPETSKVFPDNYSVKQFKAALETYKRTKEIRGRGGKILGPVVDKGIQPSSTPPSLSAQHTVTRREIESKEEAEEVSSTEEEFEVTESQTVAPTPISAAPTITQYSDLKPQIDSFFRNFENWVQYQLYLQHNQQKDDPNLLAQRISQRNKAIALNHAVNALLIQNSARVAPLTPAEKTELKQLHFLLDHLIEKGLDPNKNKVVFEKIKQRYCSNLHLAELYITAWLKPGEYAIYQHKLSGGFTNNPSQDPQNWVKLDDDAIDRLVVRILEAGGFQDVELTERLAQAVDASIADRLEHRFEWRLRFPKVLKVFNKITTLFPRIVKGLKRVGIIKPHKATPHFEFPLTAWALTKMRFIQPAKITTDFTEKMTSARFAEMKDALVTKPDSAFDELVQHATGYQVQILKALGLPENSDDIPAAKRAELSKTDKALLDQFDWLKVVKTSSSVVDLYFAPPKTVNQDDVREAIAYLQKIIEAKGSDGTLYSSKYPDLLTDVLFAQDKIKGFFSPDWAKRAHELRTVVEASLAKVSPTIEKERRFIPFKEEFVSERTVWLDDVEMTYKQMVDRITPDNLQQALEELRGLAQDPMSLQYPYHDIVVQIRQTIEDLGSTSLDLHLYNQNHEFREELSAREYALAAYDARTSHKQVWKREMIPGSGIYSYQSSFVEPKGWIRVDELELLAHLPKALNYVSPERLRVQDPTALAIQRWIDKIIPKDKYDVDTRTLIKFYEGDTRSLIGEFLDENVPTAATLQMTFVRAIYLYQNKVDSQDPRERELLRELITTLSRELQALQPEVSKLRAEKRQKFGLDAPMDLSIIHPSLEIGAKPDKDLISELTHLDPEQHKQAIAFSYLARIRNILKENKPEFQMYHQFLRRKAAEIEAVITKVHLKNIGCENAVLAINKLYQKDDLETERLQTIIDGAIDDRPILKPITHEDYHACISLLLSKLEQSQSAPGIVKRAQAFIQQYSQEVLTPDERTKLASFGIQLPKPAEPELVVSKAIATPKPVTTPAAFQIEVSDATVVRIKGLIDQDKTDDAFNDITRLIDKIQTEGDEPSFQLAKMLKDKTIGPFIARHELEFSEEQWPKYIKIVNSLEAAVVKEEAPPTVAVPKEEEVKEAVAGRPAVKATPFDVNEFMNSTYKQMEKTRGTAFSEARKALNATDKNEAQIKAITDFAIFISLVSKSSKDEIALKERCIIECLTYKLSDKQERDEGLKLASFFASYARVEFADEIIALISKTSPEIDKDGMRKLDTAWNALSYYVLPYYNPWGISIGQGSDRPKTLEEAVSEHQILLHASPYQSEKTLQEDIVFVDQLVNEIDKLKTESTPSKTQLLHILDRINALQVPLAIKILDEELRSVQSLLRSGSDQSNKDLQQITSNVEQLVEEFDKLKESTPSLEDIRNKLERLNELRKQITPKILGFIEIPVARDAQAIILQMRKNLIELLENFSKQINNGLKQFPKNPHELQTVDLFPHELQTVMLMREQVSARKQAQTIYSAPRPTKPSEDAIERAQAASERVKTLLEIPALLDQASLSGAYPSSVAATEVIDRARKFLGDQTLVSFDHPKMEQLEANVHATIAAFINNPTDEIRTRINELTSTYKILSLQLSVDRLSPKPESAAEETEEARMLAQTRRREAIADIVLNPNDQIDRLILEDPKALASFDRMSATTQATIMRRATARSVVHKELSSSRLAAGSVFNMKPVDRMALLTAEEQGFVKSKMRDRVSKLEESAKGQDQSPKTLQGRLAVTNDLIQLLAQYPPTTPEEELKDPDSSTNKLLSLRENLISQLRPLFLGHVEDRDLVKDIKMRNIEFIRSNEFDQLFAPDAEPEERNRTKAIAERFVKELTTSMRPELSDTDAVSDFCASFEFEALHKLFDPKFGLTVDKDSLKTYQDIVYLGTINGDVTVDFSKVSLYFEIIKKRYNDPVQFPNFINKLNTNVAVMIGDGSQPGILKMIKMMEEHRPGEKALMMSRMNSVMGMRKRPLDPAYVMELAFEKNFIPFTDANYGPDYALWTSEEIGDIYFRFCQHLSPEAFGQPPQEVPKGRIPFIKSQAQKSAEREMKYVQELQRHAYLLGGTDVVITRLVNTLSGNEAAQRVFNKKLNAFLEKNLNTPNLAQFDVVKILFEKGLVKIDKFAIFFSKQALADEIGDFKVTTEADQKTHNEWKFKAADYAEAHSKFVEQQKKFQATKQIKPEDLKQYYLALKTYQKSTAEFLDATKRLKEVFKDKDLEKVILLTVQLETEKSEVDNEFNRTRTRFVDEFVNVHVLYTVYGAVTGQIVPTVTRTPLIEKMVLALPTENRKEIESLSYQAYLKAAAKALMTVYVEQLSQSTAASIKTLDKDALESLHSHAYLFFNREFGEPWNPNAQELDFLSDILSPERGPSPLQIDFPGFKKDSLRRDIFNALKQASAEINDLTPPPSEPVAEEILAEPELKHAAAASRPRVVTFKEDLEDRREVVSLADELLGCQNLTPSLLDQRTELVSTLKTKPLSEAFKTLYTYIWALHREKNKLVQENARLKEKSDIKFNEELTLFDLYRTLIEYNVEPGGIDSPWLFKFGEEVVDIDQEAHAITVSMAPTAVVSEPQQEEEVKVSSEDAAQKLQQVYDNAVQARKDFCEREKATLTDGDAIISYLQDIPEADVIEDQLDNQYRTIKNKLSQIEKEPSVQNLSSLIDYLSTTQFPNLRQTPELTRFTIKRDTAIKELIGLLVKERDALVALQNSTIGQLVPQIKEFAAKFAEDFARNPLQGRFMEKLLDHLKENGTRIVANSREYRAIEEVANQAFLEAARPMMKDAIKKVMPDYVKNAGAPLTPSEEQERKGLKDDLDRLQQIPKDKLDQIKIIREKLADLKARKLTPSVEQERKQLMKELDILYETSAENLDRIHVVKEKLGGFELEARKRHAEAFYSPGDLQWTPNKAEIAYVERLLRMNIPTGKIFDHEEIAAAFKDAYREIVAEVQPAVIDHLKGHSERVKQIAEEMTHGNTSHREELAKIANELTSLHIDTSTRSLAKQYILELTAGPLAPLLKADSHLLTVAEKDPWIKLHKLVAPVTTEAELKEFEEVIEGRKQYGKEIMTNVMAYTKEMIEFQNASPQSKKKSNQRDIVEHREKLREISHDLLRLADRDPTLVFSVIDQLKENGVLEQLLSKSYLMPHEQAAWKQLAELAKPLHLVLESYDTDPKVEQFFRPQVVVKPVEAEVKRAAEDKPFESSAALKEYVKSLLEKPQTVQKPVEAEIKAAAEAKPFEPSAAVKEFVKSLPREKALEIRSLIVLDENVDESQIDKMSDAVQRVYWTLIEKLMDARNDPEKEKLLFAYINSKPFAAISPVIASKDNDLIKIFAPKEISEDLLILREQAYKDKIAEIDKSLDPKLDFDTIDFVSVTKNICDAIRFYKDDKAKVDKLTKFFLPIKDELYVRLNTGRLNENNKQIIGNVIQQLLQLQTEHLIAAKVVEPWIVLNSLVSQTFTQELKAKPIPASAIEGAEKYQKAIQDARDLFLKQPVDYSQYVSNLKKYETSLNDYKRFLFKIKEGMAPNQLLEVERELKQLSELISQVMIEQQKYLPGSDPQQRYMKYVGEKEFEKIKDLLIHPEKADITSDQRSKYVFDICSFLVNVKLSPAEKATLIQNLDFIRKALMNHLITHREHTVYAITKCWEMLSKLPDTIDLDRKNWAALMIFANQYDLIRDKIAKSKYDIPPNLHELIFSGEIEKVIGVRVIKTTIIDIYKEHLAKIRKAKIDLYSIPVDRTKLDIPDFIKKLDALNGLLKDYKEFLEHSQVSQEVLARTPDRKAREAEANQQLKYEIEKLNEFIGSVILIKDVLEHPFQDVHDKTRTRGDELRNALSKPKVQEEDVKEAVEARTHFRDPNDVALRHIQFTLFPELNPEKGGIPEANIKQKLKNPKTKEQAHRDLAYWQQRLLAIFEARPDLASPIIRTLTSHEHLGEFLNKKEGEGTPLIEQERAGWKALESKAQEFLKTAKTAPPPPLPPKRPIKAREPAELSTPKVEQELKQELEQGPQLAVHVVDLITSKEMTKETLSSELIKVAKEFEQMLKDKPDDAVTLITKLTTKEILGPFLREKNKKLTETAKQIWRKLHYEAFFITVKQDAQKNLGELQSVFDQLVQGPLYSKEDLPTLQEKFKLNRQKMEMLLQKDPSLQKSFDEWVTTLDLEEFVKAGIIDESEKNAWFALCSKVEMEQKLTVEEAPTEAFDIPIRERGAATVGWTPQLEAKYNELGLGQVLSLVPTLKGIVALTEKSGFTFEISSKNTFVTAVGHSKNECDKLEEAINNAFGVGVATVIQRRKGDAVEINFNNLLDGTIYKDLSGEDAPIVLGNTVGTWLLRAKDGKLEMLVVPETGVLEKATLTEICTKALPKGQRVVPQFDKTLLLDFSKDDTAEVYQEQLRRDAGIIAKRVDSGSMDESLATLSPQSRCYLFGHADSMVSLSGVEVGDIVAKLKKNRKLHWKKGDQRLDIVIVATGNESAKGRQEDSFAANLSKELFYEGISTVIHVLNPKGTSQYPYLGITTNSEGTQAVNEPDPRPVK